MSDGLHIRWRETAPDRGLLAFALSEIDTLHSAWPETLDCNIVIERAGRASARGAASDGFYAHVALERGRREPCLRATGLHDNAYSALRSAFDDLRDSLRAHVAGSFAGDQAA